jgi:hypothetical protein
VVIEDDFMEEESIENEIFDHDNYFDEEPESDQLN